MVLMYNRQHSEMVCDTKMIIVHFQILDLLSFKIKLPKPNNLNDDSNLLNYIPPQPLNFSHFERFKKGPVKTQNR